jgi:hypothetical protein
MLNDYSFKKLAGSAAVAGSPFINSFELVPVG